MLVANNFDHKSLFDKFESFFATMNFIKAFSLILLFPSNANAYSCLGWPWCVYDRHCKPTEECFSDCPERLPESWCTDPQREEMPHGYCLGLCKPRPTPPPGPPPSHPRFCETRESCQWWLGEECINGHCGLGRIQHAFK